MKLNCLKTLALSIALCFSANGIVHAQALETLNPPIEVAVKKKLKKSNKSEAGGGSKATFSPGSQETVKQRSTRLSRECKGQTNAGACSGYTR